MKQGRILHCSPKRRAERLGALLLLSLSLLFASTSCRKPGGGILSTSESKKEEATSSLTASIASSEERMDSEERKSSAANEASQQDGELRGEEEASKETKKSYTESENLKKKREEIHRLYDEWEHPQNMDMRELRSKMKAQIANYYTDENTLSMGYMDMTTGLAMTINGDLDIRAGSAAKLFIGMYISELVNDGLFSWDDQLQVKFHEDWDGDTGEISNGPDMQDYELSRLMYCMLTQSDNAATSCISRNWVKRSPTHDYEADLNERFGFHYDQNHVLSPVPVLLGLKDLYEDKKGIYSRMKREFMPDNWWNNLTTDKIWSSHVLHKTGTAFGNQNDFGIVYAKYPYVFTFFTTGEIDGTDKVLQELGLCLYQYHVERTQGYTPEG